MQVHRKRMRLGGALLALALAATACGGDDGGGGDGGTGTGTDEGAGGGKFSLWIGEPENPLIPTNTTETAGGAVVDALFTGLVQYDPETSEQTEGVAESIESEDSQTWTITLKDWTFHDGSPVTAESFVKAWNYGANPANAQGASYFFANIEGYEQLQAEGGAAAPEPTMTGLEVIDDKTFEVTLKEPFRQFPLTLGYSAFSPMPDSFFEDEAAVKALGEQPIGNGPFQATEKFSPGTGITLTKYEDYSGEDAASADEVEFRVYTELSTAYTDVQAGNLDFAPVPPDAIGTYQDEFGERAIERETSTFQYLGFPTYDPRFDDPKVRQAFSMAVDREAIAEAIFNGTRIPARSVISPVVDGHRPDACQYCEHKPEEAAALLAETDFDTSQPVELWFNAGGGHEEWVQAAGNNMRDALGIEYVLRGDLQFAEYLPLGDNKGFTGPFRLGWAMDYPSPQNYLEPLYSTEALPPAGSNATFYSNPEFDRLVDEGNRAETNEEAVEKYQQAEDVLLEDMPVMPMFFVEGQFVHSDRISNVQVDAFGNLVLEDVTVTE